MWLVLCDAADPAGAWTADKLRQRGLEPVELITGESLVSSPRWVYRLGRGSPWVETDLRDGRSIQHSEVRGVVNRLTTVPLSLVAEGPRADQEYAAQELHAFFLGWLRSFEQCIINPATPRGLCGEWRHLSEWLILAAQAGLPVPEYRRAVRNGHPTLEARPAPQLVRSIVIGTEVVAPTVLGRLDEGCKRLSRLATTPLLEVQFQLDDADWPIFAGASPLPDLLLSGQPAAEALASALLALQEAIPK